MDAGFVTTVAVCRECGGWAAVISDRVDMATRREFYRSVAEGFYDVQRMTAEEFREGGLEVCHRFRRKPEPVAQTALFEGGTSP
jgi:hypothetical protein